MWRRLAACVGALAILVTAVQAQNREAGQGHLEPKADALLKKMSDYLGAAGQFSTLAHSMVDEVRPTGQKIQLANSRHIVVRRPNRLFVELTGDIDDERVWYDGKTVTVLDRSRNVYSVIDAPDTIDKTLDHFNEHYRTTIPLADLLFSDVYGELVQNVRYGQYVGLHNVLGIKCHHLAFQQEGVDWQIWIEHGDKPVPRKIVITYKEFPGHPQFLAFLSDWDMAAQVPDERFIFSPPSGARKVDVAKHLERAVSQPVPGP